ncbi:TPA: hypothetical protein QCI64_001501 [Enterobacter asburiae]|nr:hypothetical protein [Enterobacter asburiae]HCR2018647.1 hypothetical protein [Enterobacter asburiae]HCR2024929.1 hypothetical protein [Enterobacter asburiae]HCR2035202.1 hypothetical protein [Enterobacter asburiae]HCR2039308.1 hypothetical protein [Enterobacter asburiae]
MSKFIDLAREKTNQAIAVIMEKENQIIKEAVNRHFGNDDFENNAKLCSTYTDPKSGVRKVIHDGVVLCELHPMFTSKQDDYRFNVSFNYRINS